jgi:hypothetical protein
VGQKVTTFVGSVVVTLADARAVVPEDINVAIIAILAMIFIMHPFN